MNSKKLNFILILTFALLPPGSYAQSIYSYLDDDDPEYQCTDKKPYECVSTVIAKVDVDCDGAPDSVVVKKSNSKHMSYGFMRVFDKNGARKDECLYYVSEGLYLGAIQLPFNPADDSGYVCSQRILDLFWPGKFSIKVKQEGIGQIKYIIRNSMKNIPGSWMNIADFDTAFQSYCGVFSPSDFSEIGITQSEWAGSYLGDEWADSLSVRNTKGLLLCYFAYSQLRQPYLYLPGIPKHESIVKIPVSENVILYQTAHGVLLRKGSLIRWVYFSDRMERRRWSSVEKVTVSNGRINVFLRDDAEQGEEEPKPALRFLLKDLLK